MWQCLAMEMKPNFSDPDIRQFIQKKIADFENAVIDIFEYTGEEYIAESMSLNTYKDRTRNLRGSIGYVILKGGNIIRQSYPAGGEGAAQGLALAKQVAKHYPTGIVLIVTAGMHYAVYVESKGYDVITGTGQLASDKIKQRLKKLLDKLNRA